VNDIFRAPRHPYTIGLLDSLPSLRGDAGELTPIPGSPPSVLEPVAGCPFQSRCVIGRDREICGTTRPPLLVVGEGHTSACHFVDELSATRDGRPATSGASHANNEPQEVAP
jgi:oligopeptide/dipeptide ABC transporter ATP-binding protein